MSTSFIIKLPSDNILGAYDGYPSDILNLIASFLEKNETPQYGDLLKFYFENTPRVNENAAFSVSQSEFNNLTERDISSYDYGYFIDDNKQITILKDRFGYGFFGNPKNMNPYDSLSGFIESYQVGIKAQIDNAVSKLKELGYTFAYDNENFSRSYDSVKGCCYAGEFNDSELVLISKESIKKADNFDDPYTKDFLELAPFSREYDNELYYVGSWHVPTNKFDLLIESDD